MILLSRLAAGLSAVRDLGLQGPKLSSVPSSKEEIHASKPFHDSSGDGIERLGKFVNSAWTKR